MQKKQNNGISKMENRHMHEKHMKGFFKKYSEEPGLVSAQIAIAYSLVGALWILMSDKVVAFLVNDKKSLTFISMMKGWGYVVVTGILIFSLVYAAFKRTKDTEDKLITSYHHLMQTNGELEAAYGQLAASDETLREQYEQIVENQQKLIESEERYRLVSEATNDAILEEKNGMKNFSDRWFELTGYNKEELGELEDWTILIHPDDREDVRRKIRMHQKERTSYYQSEFRLMTRSGEYKWVRARGKGLFDSSGRVYHMAGSYTDITELKQYEKKLQYLAYHDPLTGLRNRLSMTEELNKLIFEKTECMALLFVDVDNFKYVNDTMGHSFGDLLLTKISERLVQHQDDNCSIYRLGGDEFIILLNNFKGIGEVEKLAVKILKEFKNSFKIGASGLYVTASIGVSIYPEHGKSLDELLKRADIAVYKAKEAGRNRITIYNEPMNEAVTERMTIEKHLRTALENNEFELYYQPQLDINSNKVSGYEALLRWKSPELGFVSPDRFIGIAEDTHLIIPIGEWVLRNACLFLRRIHQRGYTEITISFNVSMLQLLQDNFVDMVIETLDLMGTNPKNLEIEITESILMEAYETIAGKLKLLRARGIKIALDDFGKGYSSLNYLTYLPISTLKIDKSFIDTISTNKKNKSLTDYIVKIGRSMDLIVVAEGVETQEQMNYLVKHKCTKIQGYLFSRPLPESEALRIMTPF